MSVIGLSSIFAVAPVEAGIRPSLWISQTDAGIAILAGKTFPFPPVTALLGKYALFGACPQRSQGASRPTPGRKQQYAGKLFAFGCSMKLL